MRQPIHLKTKFVLEIPENIEQNTLYVSMEYGTAIHLCCCGCGMKVVTPLTPTDWSLAYNGKGVSLQPSVGNWSFPCRSHYWIKNSKVTWARSMSQAEIKALRARDREAKAEYYGQPKDDAEISGAQPRQGVQRKRGSRRWIFWLALFIILLIVLYFLR